MSGSSNVDERVVAMNFDNGNFKKNAADTITTLDKLKTSLNMDGAKKGLDDLSESGKRFSLAHIADGVDGIANKFKALSIIGISALATLASKATTAGLSIAKSLTIDPVKAGFQEYETQLNAIQTILANTSAEGTKLKDVNGALNELNTYADKTIYNFTEMTRNIGTFTAAGVNLKTSVLAIKGIANLAAVSGSNAQQASTAMYQLSQAMAAGTVKLQDWNSVVNAGMGGKVFQNALMATARVHGVAIDKMVKSEGGFRNTLQKGWLTSSILTETLSKFTGDLSDKQLQQMGYTKKQVKEIQKFAKTANDAATKVKTFSQLMDTLKEAVGSGWTQTWQTVIGDFDESKKLWTGVSNSFGKVISDSANARNKILGDWKALGGRTVLIYAIKTAFDDVISVLKPIKEAFRDIFPAMTGKRLYEMTQNLAVLFNHLKIGDKAADALKRTFKGVFAVFSIIGQVVKGFLGMFSGLGSTVAKGAGGFLEFTAKIGDWLVKVNEALKKGEGLTNFFATFRNVLLYPIEKIKELNHWVATLFGGNIDTSGFTAFFDLMKKRLSPLVDLFKKFTAMVQNFFKGGHKAASSGGQNPIVTFINNLSKMLLNAVQSIDYNKIFDALSVGLLAGIVLALRKLAKANPLANFVSTFLGTFRGGVDKIANAITGVFGELTQTLKVMQNQIKAKTILMIAGAVALLAASAIALSLVDSKKLAAAMGALSVMFAQLVGSMKILDSGTGTKGMAKLPVIGASLILIATAIDILTISVVALSKLSWEELAKGLTGVTALLGIMVGVSYAMSSNTKGMAAGAAALIIMGGALIIMATALKMVAALSWEQLAIGLTGITVTLAALMGVMKVLQGDKTALVKATLIFALAKAVLTMALAIKLLGGMDPSSVVQGLAAMGSILLMITAFNKLAGDGKNAVGSALGLLLVAAAMKVLVGVVQLFGNMSWDEMGRGLAGLAGALVVIGAAIRTIPKSAILQAAGLLVVAIALEKIGAVLAKFAAFDWGGIAKAMVLLAGSLLIIAGGMALMTEALPGALALIVVAGALAILAPVMQQLGALEWGEILKGLVALAGLFLVLGVAALVLTPVIPVILGLGIAVGLLGIGLMAIGAAVLLFALGMTALAALGAVGAAGLTLVITAILALIPLAMQKLAEGIVAFAKVIGESGPVFVDAMTTLIMSILQTIQQVAPEIQKTFLMLVTRLLATIVTAVPQFVTAAVKLMAGILNGIAKNIGKVIDAGANLIVQFLNGLGRNIPKVLLAAANLILSFLNGIADTIRKKSGEFQDAGWNIASAIIEGMTGGLTKGVGKVADAAKNVAKSALNAAKSFLGINSPSKEFEKVGDWSTEGQANGMIKNAKKVYDAAGLVGDQALAGMKDSLSNISNVVNTNLDLQPVITPVLDLSAIKTGAAGINALVTPAPITLGSAYSKATQAATDYQANKDLANTQPTSTDPESGNVSFTQNNYSPKALSNGEIYRQTKNVISSAKGALAP